MANATSTLQTQILIELSQKYSLSLSPTWLSSLLTASPSAINTARSILVGQIYTAFLQSDIRSSLSTTAPNTYLPHNITDVNTKQVVLSHAIIVQIVEIVDIGTSKWSQIEQIERIENGEEVRGREVIRVVPIMREVNGDEGGNDNDDIDNDNIFPSTTDPRGNARAGTQQQAATTSNNRPAARSGMSNPYKNLSQGPHRLVLQDSKGVTLTAFESTPIPGLCMDMNEFAMKNRPQSNSTGQPQNQAHSFVPNTSLANNSGGNSHESRGIQIGAKVLLKSNLVVRRGMAMLTPENVTLLGGSVEVWDRKWKEGRKKWLTGEIDKESTSRGGG